MSTLSDGTSLFVGQILTFVANVSFVQVPMTQVAARRATEVGEIPVIRTHAIANRVQVTATRCATPRTIVRRKTASHFAQIISTTVEEMIHHAVAESQEQNRN